MKTVYFVRHGETRQNKAQVHQYPEDPLSDTGRAQAHKAAQALKGKSIDIVLASDLARAAETGSIIARELDVPLLYSPLLHEVRRPTFLWGKSHFSLTSLLFFARYFLTGIVGNTRYDNEETLRDFGARVGKALKMLEERPEKTLAVVTHRGVMTILPPLVRGNTAAGGLALVRSFFNILSVDNAEITTAEHDGEKWHIKRRNGNEHLR